jgi:hypothetical protein
MTADGLFLTETVYEEIIARAREGNPQEVCSILRLFTSFSKPPAKQVRTSLPPLSPS